MSTMKNVSVSSRKSVPRQTERATYLLRWIGALALAVSLAIPLADLTAKPAGKSDFVYVGTYTRRGVSKGIYGYRFTPSTGEIVPMGVMAEAPHPSFLIVSPNQRFLYSTNEHESATEPGNTVTAYARDVKTGQLTLLNKVSSKGMGPAHIAIDKTGKFLAVANFGSGSIAVYSILPDGRLGDATAFDQHSGSGGDPVRQAGPHAHCVLFSPDNRFLLVAEHGLDKIFVYKFNSATGSLEPNDPAFVSVKPAWAPRHLAFHPNGKYLYAISEIGSKLSTFDYDAAHGTLKEVQSISALPDGYSGESRSAEVELDRAGKFLYGSNRGDNSIIVTSVSTKDGTLTPVEFVSTQGKTPRNFSLDPGGDYFFVGNQDSDTVVIFRVDRATGKLTPTGQVLKDAPEPSCVLFVAAQ
jgi:6-phosphogluconolactonase